MLHTPYTFYVFQPLSWPSSGKCITKNICIGKLQKNTEFSVVRITLAHSCLEGSLLHTYKHTVPYPLESITDIFMMYSNF